MKETESSKDGLSGDAAVVLEGDSAGFSNTCCRLLVLIPGLTMSQLK